MQAQLTHHQWKDRILLVFAEHPSDSLFLQQMTHFQDDVLGLEDRGLVIYQIYKEKGITPKGKDLSAKNTKQLRAKYRVSDDSYTIILIGKDGGEKLNRTNKILTRKVLYQTIDSMPMRRAEMRRKN